MVGNHIALIAGGCALVLTALAELLHLRRTQKLAHLAFGPEGKARSWTILVPVLRCLSLTGLVWGFTVLLLLTPEVKQERGMGEDEYRRVVVLLDVSPSMQVRDGGVPEMSEDGEEQTRAQRAAEILESLLNRLYQEEMQFTVVAFYTSAKTVVEDSKDPMLVRNIMHDLPLTYAFEGGKTDLFAGLTHTFEMAQEWPDESATVIMVTDGDSIPATGTPLMPPSISKFLVVGVGDTTTGTHVHEHLSRQDGATLRQLAARLGGDYQDVNSKHLSSQLIEDLTVSARPPHASMMGMREYAKSAVLCGAVVLLLLPLLLERWGAQWKLPRNQTRKLP